MRDIAKHILSNTRDQLEYGKGVLSGLQPSFFMGAGLQFVSLMARQVLFESITGKKGDQSQIWSNEELQDTAWLVKHQREVAVFFQYCQCVDGMRSRGAPLDAILQNCNCHNPEVQLGSSWIISEAMRKVLQWLQQA